MRIRRGALAPILCAALGCGGPQRPALAPPAGSTRHYQPLGMRADARQTGQAVILGTDPTDGSTVLAIPTTPSTAVVEAMFVTRRGPEPASGGSIAVTLTTAPLPVGPVPTARGTVQNGASDPAGDAPWRAGLASAALLAATTLGKDLDDFTFSAVPASPVDGAAASALIAGGFLATMTGEDIDPAATLTGTLNPDGTIGPVAGLPEQLQSALARGKTRLGYPSGMRLARSQATGKEVDLVLLARDHHAEAVELASVHDAYRLLTRKQLATPVPVNEAAMALDPDTLEGLDANYLAWRQRLADEWTQLLQLEQVGRLPATVGIMARFAQDRSAQGETLYRAGELPAASGRMQAAWVYAAGANTTYAVLAKLQAGDLDGAVATLAALDATGGGTGAILTKLGALRPATLSGHVAMIAALEAALRGASYHGFAADSMHAATQVLAELKGTSPAELGSAATGELVANAVAPTILTRFRTIAEASVAEQALALEPDRGVPYAGSPPDLTRLAAGFQVAAAAGLDHVDALLIEPLARSAGITDGLARQRVASVEPDYLIAAALARLPDGGLPRELATSWGEGSLGGSLLTLAAHAVAYRSAALLIAKYDSLAVHVGDTGKIDAVEHAKAFRSLLASARRAARASARAARIAAGAIPVPAKLAYHRASVDQAGSIDDQLEALAELWTASAFCQVAVMLARH